jgi:hypothetical protein
MPLRLVRGTLMRTRPRVSGSPVSGIISLAMATAAGADMTLAHSRCAPMLGMAPLRIATYAAITPPAIVAMPAFITQNSSDSVISSTYGRMSSGASVMPMKMFAATASDSAPLTASSRITRAIPRTTSCSTP